MVRKALGLQRSVQGHADPNVNLSAQVDDYTQEEFYVLRRGALCEFFTDTPPGAGLNGCWTLTPSPGTLAVVRAIQFNNFAGGTQTYRWGFTNADAGMTAGFPQQRDQRMRGKLSAIVPSFGTIAGPSLPSGGQINVPIGTSLIVPVSYVLTASDATVFKVVNAVPNQIGEVRLVWTERPLGPQEL